jgi:hypothetical protein
LGLTEAAVPKGLKVLCGVLLLPLAVGGTQTLFQVVRAGAAADRFWVATLSGVAAWGAIYALLPRPWRLYVLAHELTHALAAWCQGRRVRRLRVGARGGSVTVDRPNWSITLAPYFFPLYAALVGAGFGIGDLVWDWGAYAAGFHFLLGGAYAFHVTFTVQALGGAQSDLAREGAFFSGVVIWIGNLLVLVLAVPVLTRGTGVLTALGWWLDNAGEVVAGLARVF